MTRQKKSLRQRAEETLAVAQRKRDRLHKEVIVRTAELKAAESDLAEAERRLDYAKNDPALQGSSTPTTEETA